LNLEKLVHPTKKQRQATEAADANVVDEFESHPDICIGDLTVA
jgi:hypothetical protein